MPLERVQVGRGRETKPQGDAIDGDQIVAGDYGYMLFHLVSLSDVHQKVQGHIRLERRSRARRAGRAVRQGRGLERPGTVRMRALRNAVAVRAAAETVRMRSGTTHRMGTPR